MPSRWVDATCIQHHTVSSPHIALAHPAQQHTRPLQTHQIVARLFEAFQVLGELATEAVGSAAADGMPDSLAAQLQAAAASLQEQHQQLQARLAPAATLSARMAVPQQLQQPAAELAALLRQHPEVEANRQLVVARAAATRSCAFLRCSSVGCGGGPAAGQGLGSLRVRAAPGGEDGAAAVLPTVPLPTCSLLLCPTHLQCLPRGVVLRPCLPESRLAGGAQAHLQAAGGGAPGGEAGGRSGEVAAPAVDSRRCRRPGRSCRLSWRPGGAWP